MQGHSSLQVLQFLTGKNISALDHPPCSPGLVPTDFWLFPKLKECAERTVFLGQQAGGRLQYLHM
jgi:hypothetical protein